MSQPTDANYQTLLFAVSDGVATITLNRPDAANAMNLQMVQEFAAAAIRCEQDQAIRAVLINAAGKMFCAGGDLPSFAAAGDGVGALITDITMYLHATVSRLMRMDKPVVVAVNGAAAGAGFSLAMAGDIVLAAESARFSLAYTAIGVSPDGGASYILPRLIGLRRSAELMLTNRRLNSHEAAQWGLVTRVVDDAELASEAKEIAQQLAQGATQAFGKVKQLLAASMDNGLETQMALEAQSIAELAMSPDGREGITAFMERRAPTFNGHPGHGCDKTAVS